MKLAVIIGRHVHARGGETQSLHYLFDISNIGGSSNGGKRSGEPSRSVARLNSRGVKMKGIEEPLSKAKH